MFQQFHLKDWLFLPLFKTLKIIEIIYNHINRFHNNLGSHVMHRICPTIIGITQNLHGPHTLGDFFSRDGNPLTKLALAILDKVLKFK